MISLVCIDSKLLTNNNWYGRFQLAPFRKSEGLTVANALRRTLLAEKSNFYISWVDLYNAEIPYSVLTGMRESVFDILLNLKQIIFTSDTMMAHRFHASNLNMSLNTNKLKNQFPKKEKIFQARQPTNKYYEKNESFPVGISSVSSSFPSLFSRFSHPERVAKEKKSFPFPPVSSRLDSNFIRDFLSYRESSPLNDFLSKAKTKSFNSNFYNKEASKSLFRGSSFMRSSTEPPTNSSEETYKKQQAGFQESKIANMNSYIKNKNFFSKSNDFCNPVIIGYICVKGPATIYGKNLKLPKGLKCLNPDQYIVTLSDDGVFYFRFAIHYELKNQLVFNAIPRDFPFFPTSLIELNQNQNIFWQTLFSNINTISLPNPQRKLFEQTKTKVTDSNKVFHQNFLPSWQIKIKKSLESIKKKKLLKTNIFKNFYILHFSPKKDFRQAKNFFNKTLKINSLFLQFLKTRVSLFHTFSSVPLSFSEKKMRKENNSGKEKKFSELPNSKSKNLNLFRPIKLDNYFWSWQKNAFFLNNKSFFDLKKEVATSRRKYFFFNPFYHQKSIKEKRLPSLTSKSQFKVFCVFKSETDRFVDLDPLLSSLSPLLHSKKIPARSTERNETLKKGKKQRTSFDSQALKSSKKQLKNLPAKNKLILRFGENKPQVSFFSRLKKKSFRSSPFFFKNSARQLPNFQETSNRMAEVFNTPWFLENVYQNFFICFRKKKRCFKLNSLGLIEKSLNSLAKSENNTLKKISAPLISPTNIEEKKEKNSCTCQNSSILSNIKKTCLINLQVKHSYYKSGCLDRFLVDLLKVFKPSISFRVFSSIDLKSVDAKENLPISFPKKGYSLRVARQNRKQKFINKPNKALRKKNNNLRSSATWLHEAKRDSYSLFLHLYANEKILPVWDFKTTNTFNIQFFISSLMQKKKTPKKIISLTKPPKKNIFLNNKAPKKPLKKNIFLNNKAPKKPTKKTNEEQIIIVSQKQKRLIQLDSEIYKEKITEFLKSQQKDFRHFTWTQIAHQFNLYQYYNTKSKEWKQLQEWFKGQKKPQTQDKPKKKPQTQDKPKKEPPIKEKSKKKPPIKDQPKKKPPIEDKLKKEPPIKYLPPKKQPPIKYLPPKKNKQKINLKKNRQKLIPEWTLQKPIFQNQHLLKWGLGIKNFLDIGIIAEKTFYNKLEFLKNKKKLNFSSLPNSNNNNTQLLTFFIPNNTIILKPSYLNIEPLFHILKQSVKFHENQRILSRNLNLFFSVSISFILLVLISHLFSLVGTDITTRFDVVKKSVLANFFVNDNFYLPPFSAKTFQLSSQEIKKRHRAGNRDKKKRRKNNMVSETTLFLGHSEKKEKKKLALAFSKKQPKSLLPRLKDKRYRNLKATEGSRFSGSFLSDAKTKHITLKSSTKIKNISSDIESNLNKLLLWSCLWPLVSKPFKRKTLKQISIAFLKEKKIKPTAWARKYNRGKIKNFNILWNSNDKKKITCSKKYYQTFYHSKIYFSLRYTYPLKYTIFSHYSSMGWFSKSKSNSVGKAILNRLSFFSKIGFFSFVSFLKKNIAKKKSQIKKQKPVRGLKTPIKKINSTFFFPLRPLSRINLKNIDRKQTGDKQTVKKKNFYYLPPKNVKPSWVPYSESFKIYTNLMTYENLFNYKVSNRASLIQKTDGTITKTDNFFLLNEKMNQINNFSFLNYEMDLEKENFSIFFPYKSFVIPWNPKKDKNSQPNTINLRFLDDLTFSKPPEKVKKVFSIYDKSALVNFEIFKDTYLEKINNGTLYNSIRNFYLPFDYLLNHIILPSFYWFNSVTVPYQQRHKTRTITESDWEKKKNSLKNLTSSPFKTKNYQRFIPTMSINIIKKSSIIKAKIKNNSLSTDVKNYIQKYLTMQTYSNNKFLIELILFIYSQRKKKNFQIMRGSAEPGNQNMTTKILNQKTFNDGFILVNSSDATSEQIFSFSEKPVSPPLAPRGSSFLSSCFSPNSELFTRSLAYEKYSDPKAVSFDGRKTRSKIYQLQSKPKVFFSKNGDLFSGPSSPSFERIKKTTQVHGKKEYPSGISNVKTRKINQKNSSKEYLKISKNPTNKSYNSLRKAQNSRFSDSTPYFLNSLAIKPKNYQKQWIGPSKKTIEIYKSHFPYTFLSREKNNVFFSNFTPTNLVSISSEIETILLSNKEISWFQPNHKSFQLHSPSQLLLQTFIKTHSNHYLRNKNFLLAYLNTKKFTINPFKKQDGYDSLFKYLKSCQIQKSLIPENLLTTYKYFQSSNLLKDDFLKSLIKKDSLTSEFFEFKEEDFLINNIKFSADKHYKKYLFQSSFSSSNYLSSSFASNLKKQNNELRKARPNKAADKPVLTSPKNAKLFYNKSFLDPKSKAFSFSAPFGHEKGKRDKKIKNLFIARKKESSLKKTFLFPFSSLYFANSEQNKKKPREKWGRKRNKWQQITEKKLVKTLSNTQWVMANSFPQNFTIKSKNFNFYRLNEKMKIPVAFEIFLNRRFLWNSNKITLQILNRQASMVSLASDRKFKMTTLKPLFKEAKIKKIAFLKHGSRQINHQQKVSKIMFSNLQLSNLKNYQNYFSIPYFSPSKVLSEKEPIGFELDEHKTRSKFYHPFGYEFSWLNKIQQIFKKEKKIPVNRLPFFIQKSILSLSYSNSDLDHNTVSTKKRKNKNEQLEPYYENSLAIFKEIRLPAPISRSFFLNSSLPFSPRAASLVRFTKKTKNNKGEFVDQRPFFTNTIDKFLPFVYSLIGEENEFFTNLSEHKLKRVTNQLNKSLVPINWKLFSLVEQNMAMALKEIKRFYAFFLKPSFANFSENSQPTLDLFSQTTEKANILGAAQQAETENNQIDLWSCTFFSKYFVYTTSLESDLFFQNFLNFSFSKFDLNKIFSKKPTFSISKSYFTAPSVFPPLGEAFSPASRSLSFRKRENVGKKRLYSQKKAEKELMKWNDTQKLQKPVNIEKHDSQPLVKKSSRATKSALHSKDISSMLVSFNRYFLRSFEEQSKEGLNKRRLKNLSKETMPTTKDNTISFNPKKEILENKNTLWGFPTDGKRKKKLFYFGKLTQKIETNQVLLRPIFQTERIKDEMVNVFQNFYLISRQLGFSKMGRELKNKSLQIGSAEEQIFPWLSSPLAQKARGLEDNISWSKNKHKITLCYFTIKESLNPIYKVNYIIENFEMTWDKIPINFRKKQPKKPRSWNSYVQNLFPLHVLTKQTLIGSILNLKTNQQNMEKIMPPYSFSIHYGSKKRKKSIRFARLTQKIEDKKKRYLVMKNSDRLYRFNSSLSISENIKKTKLFPGKSINKWQIWYSFLIKKNKTSLIVLNNYNGVISIPKWKNENSFLVPFDKSLNLSKETMQKLHINHPLNFEMNQPGSFYQRANNNEIIQNSDYNQINPIENDIKNEYIQIDIWTNGSISPRQSLVNAFQKLFELFCNLSNNSSIKNNNVLVPEKEKQRVFKIIDESKPEEKKKKEEEKNENAESTESESSSSLNSSQLAKFLNPDNPHFQNRYNPIKHIRKH